MPPGMPPGITSVAGVLMLRDDGAALFQLRDEKPGLRGAGQWGLLAGARQPGEPPEACARRELQEETGYVCGDLDWLASFYLAHEPGHSHAEVTVFWTRYDGVQPLQCFEGQAIRFLERSRADAYPIVKYLPGIWDLGLIALHARQNGHPVRARQAV